MTRKLKLAMLAMLLALPVSGHSQTSAAEQKLVEEVRAAATDPARLDQLFERVEEQHKVILADTASGVWKKVFLDPDTSPEQRRIAEDRMRRYAAVMMASEETYTHEGTTIPRTRWRGQSLLTTVDHMSPGKVMPDFDLTTLEGKPVSLADHRGKVLFIDYWATWCKPCMAAMPGLKAFADEWKGRAFEVIAVNSGEVPGTVRDFLARGEVPMPWVHWRQEAMTEKYFVSGIATLPTYFVLDHNGVILARGSKLDDRMKQTIRNAVEAASSESSR